MEDFRRDVKTLQEMFPTIDQEVLTLILKESGGIDAAINELLEMTSSLGIKVNTNAINSAHTNENLREPANQQVYRRQQMSVVKTREGMNMNTSVMTPSPRSFSTAPESISPQSTSNSSKQMSEDEAFAYALALQLAEEDIAEYEHQQEQSKKPTTLQQLKQQTGLTGSTEDIAKKVRGHVHNANDAMIRKVKKYYTKITGKTKEDKTQKHSLITDANEDEYGIVSTPSPTSEDKRFEDVLIRSSSSSNSSTATTRPLLVSGSTPQGRRQPPRQGSTNLSTQFTAPPQVTSPATSSTMGNSAKKPVGPKEALLIDLSDPAPPTNAAAVTSGEPSNGKNWTTFDISDQSTIDKKPVIAAGPPSPFSQTHASSDFWNNKPEARDPKQQNMRDPNFMK